MKQEQVWNKIAEKWQKFREKTPEEVAEFLKTKKGKILDLGCGGGRNFVKNPKIRYYGVDFSKEMLKFAEAKAKKIGVGAIFFKENLDKLPFSSNFFDGAIFISTLHCIETGKERKKTLKELYRVLKKNGEAMITVWDKNNNKNLSRINENEAYVNWSIFGKKYRRYYYFYKKSELISLLKEIGFGIVQKKLKKSENHSKKNIIIFVKKIRG